MAEGIREGKSVNPDFDVAVERHQLLDDSEGVGHRDPPDSLATMSDRLTTFSPTTRPSPLSSKGLQTHI
jgi:hypothetical protein